MQYYPLLLESTLLLGQAHIPKSVQLLCRYYNIGEKLDLFGLRVRRNPGFWKWNADDTMKSLTGKQDTIWKLPTATFWTSENESLKSYRFRGHGTWLRGRVVKF